MDNNAIEAMLKIVVRDRKNAMFHKTLLGATIGDVITSMMQQAVKQAST
jgi:transposase